MGKYKIVEESFAFDVNGYCTQFINYSVKVKGCLFWHTVKDFCADVEKPEDIERAKWDAEELYKLLIEDRK